MDGCGSTGGWGEDLLHDLDLLGKTVIVHWASFQFSRLPSASSLARCVFLQRPLLQLDQLQVGAQENPGLDIVFNPSAGPTPTATPTSAPSATATPTPTPAGPGGDLVANGGFEAGAQSWTASPGVIGPAKGEPPHSGTWRAWLGGYGTVATDTLSQQVAISASVTTATLTFWLHIDTAETTTTRAYDTLEVQVRDASGAVQATLARYSNLDAAPGFAQKSLDVSAFKGQTVTLYLVATEDARKQTSFVVDDFALAAH